MLFAVKEEIGKEFADYDHLKWDVGKSGNKSREWL